MTASSSRPSQDEPPPYSPPPIPETPNISESTPSLENTAKDDNQNPAIYRLFPLHTVLRILQFLLAITISALYGVDLRHATKAHVPAPSEWIYAEVVACLSAITCIVHCAVTTSRVWSCIWDVVLFVLWLAQVGVFANIYYPRTREGYGEGPGEATTSVERMRGAMWVCVVSLVLSLGMVVFGVGGCFGRRSGRGVEGGDVEQGGGRRFWEVCGRRRKGVAGEESGELERGFVEVGEVGDHGLAFQKCVVDGMQKEKEGLDRE
ncbi:hypothetical protein BJX61DRAFT_541607 [Aspergillus egyptiacus]|nr:hypothetical protein BJX61DRAFT_541607 [Aspergillus egyptiacus]